MLPQTVYNALPGATEGLGNSLYRAAHEEPTLDGVLAAAKSKRYALARIRRMTMCAALGVTAGMDGDAAVCAGAGHRCAGQGAAARVDARTAVPVITSLPPGAVCRTRQGRSALTADAHDLYVLGCPAQEERRCGVPTGARARSCCKCGNTPVRKHFKK